MLTDGPLQKPESLIKNLHYKKSNLCISEKHAIVGSGKSAITLSLGFLRELGILKTRMALIFCPPWLGSWIYSTISNKAFPTLEFSAEVKCLYVYHQFGFIQDIEFIKNFAQDKKIPVIEDSAHLLGFKDGILNFSLLSDFALASPPKFIDSPPIGIIQTENKAFHEYIKDTQRNTNKLIVSRNRLASYLIDRKMDLAFRNNTYIKNIENLSRESSRLYSSYPYIHMSSRSAHNRLVLLLNEFELRKKRLKDVYDVIPHSYLPDKSKLVDHVTPFKIPVKMTDKQVLIINQSTKAQELGLVPLNFDFAQNMLKSSYSKAIAIKIHSQITNKEFAEQVSFILGIL